MSTAISGSDGRTSAIGQRLRPKSVAGQLALLVLAAIVATHAVATVAFFLLREPWAEGRPGVAANRVAVIARLLDAGKPDERAALLALAGRTMPTLGLEPWDGTGASADDERVRDHPVVERLRDAFGQPLAVAALPGEASGGRGAPPLQLGLRTPNGALFRASLPDDAPGPPKRGAIIFTLLFFATTLTLLSLWATRALTAPLAQLADAAEAFGTRAEPPPLPQTGPEEVLALAGALDRMRARVARLLEDRTQMLAAVSHDLRTPITRLRLRAEFIEDELARERTLRDLDQMNGLVEATLAYARDERRGDTGSDRDRPLIDLASLVQTVCDGFADTGADVELGQIRNVLVRADPDDLQRALNNLVDNAVKYGGRAQLSMHRTDQGVAIAVADDGPGIPESEREAMLKPFVRGDPARSQDGTSGFGLGLSIVLAVVEAQGGQLHLANRPGGGLVARIELPIVSESGAGQRSPASRQLEHVERA